MGRCWPEQVLHFGLILEPSDWEGSLQTVRITVVGATSLEGLLLRLSCSQGEVLLRNQAVVPLVSSFLEEGPFPFLVQEAVLLLLVVLLPFRVEVHSYLGVDPLVIALLV